jgi:hypothetical protein
MPAPLVDPGDWLGRAELALFLEQSEVDQRHASRVARLLMTRGHVDKLLIQAALLHDVGKAGGGIRLWHRIGWVLLGRLAPGPRSALARRGGTWAALAGHETIGAARLHSAGADPRLVGLVGGRPLPGDEHRARLLRAADDAV